MSPTRSAQSTNADLLCAAQPAQAASTRFGRNALRPAKRRTRVHAACERPTFSPRWRQHCCVAHARRDGVLYVAVASCRKRRCACADHAMTALAASVIRVQRCAVMPLRADYARMRVDTRRKRRKPVVRRSAPLFRHRASLSCHSAICRYPRVCRTRCRQAQRHAASAMIRAVFASPDNAALRG